MGQPLESKIYNFRAHPRVLAVLQGRFDALAVSEAIINANGVPTPGPRVSLRTW